MVLGDEAWLTSWEWFLNWEKQEDSRHGGIQTVLGSSSFKGECNEALSYFFLSHGEH